MYNKQLVFCLETNSNSRTDYTYILETINHLYDLEKSGAIINVVYMEGKTNYNSENVENKINHYINMFKNRYHGSTHVIYCIDTECENLSFTKFSRNDNIVNYCKDRNYDLVFFLKNVEEVYWKKSISDNEKIEYSNNFAVQKLISKVKMSDLKQNEPARYQSNLLTKLDKYLIKK